MKRGGLEINPNAVIGVILFMVVPNLETEQKRIFLRRWIVVLVYTLFLLAFLPLFPVVWRFLGQLFPGVPERISYLLTPALSFVLLLYFIFIIRQKDLMFWVWSAVFLFCYFPLLYYYCEYPAERIHLVEYGLLVILLYRALKVRMRSILIYPAVFLGAFLVGLMDETIQGVLPNRVYEFKDVIINWVSSFLATGLLVAATWKNFVREQSFAVFRRWSAALIAVMLIGNGLFFYQRYWKPPLNVIILTVDTLRLDHLGCLGYERDTTPFLDSLARRTVIFNNVISSAPWTSPGLISVFTGLYPALHGVEARGRALLPGADTIFKVFKKEGFDVPNISFLTSIDNFSNLGLDTKNPVYFEEGQIPGAVLFRWLNDHHRRRFALWYHYRFLHLPYAPDERFNVFLTDRMRSSLESKGVKTVLEETVIPAGTIDFSPLERETVKALYDGQLRQFDHFLQRLFNTLTKWKLHRNTLLVITADHGEELFEHGFIGHASTAIRATMYDEVLKIPLVLYAPSRLKEGRIISQQVRQIDIMPTILEIAGLPIPQSIQGVSLLPAVEGKEMKETLNALSESVFGGYQSNSDQEKIKLRSLRTGDWKLISKKVRAEETSKLFNLKKDPGEKVDVMEMERGVAKRLKQKLNGSLSQMAAKRLLMIAGEKAPTAMPEIPEGVQLEKPTVLFPRPQASIGLKEKGGMVVVKWTGNNDFTYVIQYDVGKGWRNLKGYLTVHGNQKEFGPLPR
ncbi:VanZ family protein, partial [Thermodesulfobacteriota bacterium]